jgi:hypothetical protein
MLQLSDGYLFSGIVEYSTDQANLMLFKTDTMGNVSWFKSNYYSPSPGADSGLGVGITQMIATDDGNILCSCKCRASSVFENNSRRQKLWMRTINDTLSYSSYPGYMTFCKSNDGGYLIAGQTDFPLIPGAAVHGTGHPVHHKTDSSINIQWSKKYTFEKNFNMCSFITQLPGGDIVCAGTIYDTIVISAHNYSRFYMMRIDSNGVSSGAPCGLDTLYNSFMSNTPITLYNKIYIPQQGGQLLAYPSTAN